MSEEVSMKKIRDGPTKSKPIKDEELIKILVNVSEMTKYVAIKLLKRSIEEQKPKS